MSNRFESMPKAAALLIPLVLLALLETAGHLSYRLRHGYFLWRQPVAVLFDSYSLEKYPPNLAVKDSPFGLATDRYGFVHNGYERDIGERSGRFLIFLLGGSTVEGLKVKNDETIAAQLENILNTRKPGAFWVVNAGYHGHVSYQQLGVLAGHIAPRFKPDLVLALDGRNDGGVGTAYKDWRANWQPYYDMVDAGVNRMRDPPLWAGLPGWLLHHSSLAKLAAAARFRITHVAPDGGPKPDRAEPAPDAVVDEVVAAYFANHAAARGRSLELGYPYAVFLQPTVLSTLRPKMTELEKTTLADFLKRMYRRDDVYSSGLERFYAKASLRGQGRGWFHDLSRLFEKVDAEVYADDCHYSKQGSRLIAQAIADALRKDGLLAPRR